jgi:3'(2'), 5'-bisphosphate nucleotidase
MIEIAIPAALEAGAAILDIYAQDFEVEFKADESPLTTADKAAHEIIVHQLEQTPYPVLSEESDQIAGETRQAWKTYWLVDPLDGTKEFIKKNGEFTVNIALIENGIPVLGVVYVPVEDTLYFGYESEAWKVSACSGKTMEQLRASATACSISGTASSPLRIVASKSHCNDETLNFIKDLENKYGEPELVSRGSSLKLCMVAEGTADIYPRIAPTMEWDTAAAHAIVKAAGGEVFQYDATVAPSDYTTGSATLNPVKYNKENLLNPYFVVTGLHE